MRALWFTALAFGMAAGGPAPTEPATIDVLLAIEDIGRVEVAPDDRWVIAERLWAQDRWPRYDLGYKGGRRYGDLYIGRTDDRGPLRVLLAGDADAGYSFGGFSPSGARAAVFRLKGDEWRLGLLTLSTGDVVWTEVAPITPDFGRAFEWVGDDRLIVLGSGDGRLPYGLSRANTAQRELPQRWDLAARGRESFVVEDGSTSRILSPRYGEVVVWSVEAQQGRATPLTSGGIVDIELSYDGRTAALLVDEALPLDASQARVSRVSPRRRVRLLDTRSGATRVLADCDDVDPSLMSWSPVRAELLVFCSASATFLTVTPQGVSRPLPSPPATTGEGGTPQGAWLGDDPIVRRPDETGGRADWWRRGLHGLEPVTVGLSDPGPIRAQYTHGVAVADGTKLVNIGSDGEVRLEGEDRKGASAAELGQRGFNDVMKRSAAPAVRDGRLCRLRRPSEDLCPAGDAASPATVAWGRSAAYFIKRDPSGVSRIIRRDAVSEASVLATNLDLERVVFAQPVRVRSATASGWLYLPPAGPGPFPVVIIPYPGQVYAHPPDEMEPGAPSAARSGQPLVAAGYAVLYPDLASEPEPSVGLTAKILDVLDATAAQSSRIDAQRVGLWGWSFGAWAATVAAAQSDRFDAVVALNGPYDPFAVMGSSTLGAKVEGRQFEFAIDNARWLESGQAGMGGSYWSDPGPYRRASAVVLAEGLKAPTLLLSSDQDFNVSQADLLFGALVRLGRGPTLVTFFGEDHAVMGPGNLRQMYAQTIGWFDRYLREQASATPNAIANAAARPRSRSD